MTHGSTRRARPTAGSWRWPARNWRPMKPGSRSQFREFMKCKILFSALAGAAVLLLIAATTTEVNVANLPLATSLSPTNLVLVLTNATKARLATVQQILNVPGYKVWTNASGVLSPLGFADQAQLDVADTNNVRFSLIGGDVNGTYSHVFSTANYLTSDYQALNTDGTNEYLATLTASLDESFSELKLRKTINGHLTSAIHLDARDAPSVLIYDTNGVVFSVVTNGTITLQGQTNRIGDDGSQITFNGAAVGGGGGILTNDAGSVSLLDETESYRIVQPNNNFYAVTAGGNLTNPADYNVAIGVSALANALNAEDNIAIGTEALTSTAQADYDIAIGYRAMRLLTDGFYNVAIG